MEFTTILQALNEASAFELYRLQIAIHKELESHARIAKIKKSLRIGMDTTYFCHEKNGLVPVKVLELKPNKVVVGDPQNLQRKIILPYFMLNISNADINIYENNQKLTANNLSVGDIVGFTHNGKDIIGMIERLNQKTVSLTSTVGTKWRAGYGGLYRVHDDGNIREQILKYISTN